MYDYPIFDLERTGRNIERRRRELGYSVHYIQTVFGFESPQAIYNWQSGRNSPSIDNLVILCSILDTTIDALIATEKNHAATQSGHTYTGSGGDIPAASGFFRAA